MKMKLEQFRCYSFNKQDIAILLSFYNVTYLISWSLLRDTPKTCFVIAVLSFLFTLFAVTLIDLIQRLNEDRMKIYYEQSLVRKKIRDEYLKVHKVKRKKELLMKAGCLLPEQVEKTIVLDHTEPSFTLNKEFGKVKEVHFDYIDSTDPKENIRGQPEGT